MRRDALYRAVFDVNTAIKLLIDPGPGDDTGRILDANRAAVDFYGWSLDELRTMRITDINLLSPEEVRAEMEKARSMRRNYFHFRHRTARGDVRAVEVHSSPVDVDGHQVLLSIIHDVTERDRLEEHVRRGQRLEAIGHLAGGVAHDFNNLLTVILSAARLARTRLPPGDDLARFLDDIDGAARRGADLTRQLLAFSRRQVMTPRAIDVAGVVTELVPLLERSIGSAHTIEVEAAAAPAVVADPAQLEQVVMNLVLNARDAMRDGGAITITIGTSSGDESARIPEGAWVTIAIRDPGVGMDEATRARVFEPFFTTKPEGTGMGLATVYGIVTQSGGHVTVETARGRGTTFTVYLPVADEPARAAPAAGVRPRVVRAATILLVEDQPAVRAAIASLLGDLGHRVLSASSYDDAMATAGERLDEVDVVISDVVMPGRSGVELIRALHRRRPSLGAVVISGDLRDHVLADLPRSVIRLAKPFTLDALEDAVARALMIS